MKFTQAIALAATFIVPALSATYPLVYDTQFDNPNGAVANTICGPLASKWPTFGKVPMFPAIGGAFAINEFNSTECGSCWLLTYTRENGQNVSTYYTAISNAPTGFISSLSTALELTGKTRDTFPANVVVDATKVAPNLCAF